MAVAIKADYGYEKMTSGDVTTMQIVNQDGFKKSSIRQFAIIALVVINAFLFFALFNGNLGRALFPMLFVSAIIWIVASLLSKGKKFTTVKMGRDDLTVEGRSFAKQDITELLIRSPTLHTVAARTEGMLQWKEANQERAARERYAVTFNYGNKTFTVAAKMTEKRPPFLILAADVQRESAFRGQ